MFNDKNQFMFIAWNKFHNNHINELRATFDLKSF